MSPGVRIAAAALALIALVVLQFLRHRRWRSAAPASVAREVPVRRVELHDDLAVQVFRRPGGTYGYYYQRNADQPPAHQWVPPPHVGDGPDFADPDAAETAARAAAGPPTRLDAETETSR